MSERDLGTDAVLFIPIFVILMNRSWSFCIPEVPSVIMIQSDRCNSFSFPDGKGLELQRKPQTEDGPHAVFIFCN